MHIQRIVLLIASILGIIASFLNWGTVPYYAVRAGSEKGAMTGLSAGFGIVTLILFGLVLLISLSDKRAEQLRSSKGSKTAALILGLLSTGIGLLVFMRLENIMYSKGYYSNEYAAGLGLYLLLLSGSVTCVSVVALGDRPS